MNLIRHCAKRLLLLFILLHSIVSKSQTIGLQVDSNVYQTQKKKSFSSTMNGTVAYIAPAAMFGFGVLANNSHGLQQINREIREEVMEEPRPLSPKIEDIMQYVPVYSVFALNAAGVKSENNFVDRVFLYGLSNTIMSQTVSKVKTLSNKLRPDGKDRRSFPSGHTATAFSAAEFVRLEYQDRSPVYGIAAYTVAAATGALRIYHNKHWFSDVVAGAGVGILSTDLAYYIYPKLKQALTNVTGFKTEKLHVGPSTPFGKPGLSCILSLDR